MSSVLTFLHKVDTVIINPIIILMFAAAVLVFIYGVFEYVKDSDSEDARTTGRNHILAGIFGMFIMVSAFGIIHLVIGTIGASSSDSGVSQILGR